MVWTACMLNSSELLLVYVHPPEDSWQLHTDTGSSKLCVGLSH